MLYGTLKGSPYRGHKVALGPLKGVGGTLELLGALGGALEGPRKLVLGLIGVHWGLWGP